MRPPGAGRERVFPFYIVCDVSQSMWDRSFLPPNQRVLPYDVLREALPNLLFGLETHATVADAAMISVITFADSAQVRLPLTRPSEVVLRALAGGYATNYAAAFQLLLTSISRDCDALSRTHDVRSPVVFFLTDGRPEVDRSPQNERVWGAPLAELMAPDFLWRPRIVAFGMGRVDEATLCRVATAHGDVPLAFVSDPDADSSVVLRAILHALSVSIADTVTRGTLVVEPPAGMRLAAGPRTAAGR